MMKRYLDKLQDKRINARRSFWQLYWIISGVVIISCSGSVLMFNHEVINDMSPWIMVITISSYVFFIGLVVSIGTQLFYHSAFTKPTRKIRLAAHRVAGGDFSVRVQSQRKDNKKDELEVLIDDFNKMVEELATIETLKSDFIANVSHEIKTPLAIIQSYATALKKDGLEEAAKKEYIETILDASKKLSTLVTDVLRLNKIESQEIIELSTFSLDEQLRECILALEDRFNEKSIDFDADLDEVAITSDENLLEIVWNNLLTNAIKFTDAFGTVKIKLVRKNGCAVVSIQDTGCGMNEETCRRLFDRFYQGDTSHSSEGNGLGLSLVKRVIDLVNGNIQIESEIGSGTIFTVTLKLE